MGDLNKARGPAEPLHKEREPQWQRGRWHWKLKESAIMESSQRGLLQSSVLIFWNWQFSVLKSRPKLTGNIVYVPSVPGFHKDTELTLQILHPQTPTFLFCSLTRDTSTQHPHPATSITKAPLCCPLIPASWPPGCFSMGLCMAWGVPSSWGHWVTSSAFKGSRLCISHGSTPG